MRFSREDHKEIKIKKIGDMLGRFTVIAQNGEMTRTAVSDTLKKFGLKIDIKNITVHKELVRLKISPPQRSELFLKQGRIIEELKQNPLTKNIKRVC
jgi:hypothetical protein